MEPAKAYLEDLITKSTSKNNLFKRNLLREYLQILVLDFIYKNPKYNQLIFYGGSCLSHCFNLPRISEDLDFVDFLKKVDFKKLAEDLAENFRENTDINIKTTVTKRRIYYRPCENRGACSTDEAGKITNFPLGYRTACCAVVHLKFPILYELGLAKRGESNLLFLKVEIFKKFNFLKKDFKTEIIPLFKFNKSILIRSFDLSTLMATKLKAILYRKWLKTDKKGRTLVKVKGRDYFDLLWYLKKEIRPNLKILKEVKNSADLKEKLLNIIDKIDSQSIYLDLEALIEDRNYILNLSKNLKEILKKEIKENL